ncbi:cation transporter [Methylobacterium sp. 092160098-2]|jgi:mercuric ion binding protein|uniref:cation transporter n=1 Tax=Methylobacterium sp. 092160098-2 TaxID=3025129 RepID=UPI002381A5EA|nr:cation transporter [Methylobacterium sp. 092160098-2]MDE4915993.1 cation transporter [Methylobacterium sp. 092160098-2]
MKALVRAALTASALLAAREIMAAPRTVALEIGNVSCATCVPIVKRVLFGMSGVSQVAIVEGTGEATATVTFDDEKATVDALAQALGKAGFPTRVKQATATTPNPGVAVR